MNVGALMEFCASFGSVAINRAYGNWQWFARYREALLHNAVELIQLFPPGGAAKNGADIKLCLDAIEDMIRFPHTKPTPTSVRPATRRSLNRNSWQLWAQ